MIPAPAPGIYENVSFEEYLSWDAISASRINLACRSLAHFHENAAPDPTPALRLGGLVHCGRLEPMALAKRYAVMPPYENDPDNLTQKGERPSSPKTTSYYKLKAKDFAAANVGKEIVNDETYDRMVAIVTALARHERARSYLEAPGQIEVAIVWIDPATGLICKARLDHYCRHEDRFTDLKTFIPQPGCLPPSVKFCRSIANYGYHRQMSHYRQGLIVLTGVQCEAAIAAVDSNAPHCVMAAPVSEEWMELGAGEVSHTLERIARAYKTNDWPGYDSPDSWIPPAWYGEDGDVELVIDGQPFVV